MQSANTTTTSTTSESASITTISIVVGSSVPTNGQFYQTDNVNPNDWQRVNYSDFQNDEDFTNPLVNIVSSYDGVVQLDRKLMKMTAKLS